MRCSDPNGVIATTDLCDVQQITNIFMTVSASGDKGGRVHRWLLSSECCVLFEAVEEAKVNAWEVGWAPERSCPS